MFVAFDSMHNCATLVHSPHVDVLNCQVNLEVCFVLYGAIIIGAMVNSVRWESY